MSKRNENRPGYKETYLGWIPNGWPLKTLGTVGVFLKGKGILNNDKVESGIPCITYGEIYTTHDFVIRQFKSFLDKEIAEQSQPIYQNDLLFAGSGETLDEIGKCVAYVDSKVAYAGGDVIILSRVKESSIYLSYLINSDFIKRYRRKLGQGHSVVHIYSSGLAKLKIPIPPLPEQKKIAQILSTWDKAIEQIRKLIEAKKQLKKGLMQQLLTGRMRFPQFTKSEKLKVNSEKRKVKSEKLKVNSEKRKVKSEQLKVNSEKLKKGELPEGWQYCRLGKCFEERNEHNVALPLLSITGNRGVIPRDQVERKDTSNIDKSKYKRIVPGDIGYNTMRMWQGNSALSDLEGIVSPAYTICKPNANQSSEFYKHLFKFKPIIHLFYRYSQGLVSDTWNLKFHHFARIKVAVPNRSEQIIIANLLNTIDSKVLVLEKKLSAIEEQKKGLMQKLLTGEIRTIKSEELKVNSEKCTEE